MLNEYNELTVKLAHNGNITYNLNKLCTKERGEILLKLVKGVNTRYRFINPMMRAYVKLKAKTN